MEKNESEIEIESDKGNKGNTNEEEMSNLFNDVSGKEPSERGLLDDMNEMDEKVESDEDSDEQEDGKKQVLFLNGNQSLSFNLELFEFFLLSHTFDFDGTWNKSTTLKITFFLDQQ